MHNQQKVEPRVDEISRDAGCAVAYRRSMTVLAILFLRIKFLRPANEHNHDHRLVVLLLGGKLCYVA